MLTESVHVRLSAAEKEAAQRIAKRRRRSASNLIRSLLLSELAREAERLEMARGEGKRHQQPRGD